ncbi:MAG: RNA polymerase sigma-54 factor [Rhodobacteraceae bacterium]|nr:MAG: RNA polymerase sigma-54 factor [Paracoccaceae bacterium]
MQATTRQHLEMHPTRRLAMTGALRQAIDFLKIDNLALSRRLRTMAQTNPALVLNTLPPPAPNDPVPAQPATAPPAGTDLTQTRLAAPDASLRAHVATEIGLAFRSTEETRIASIIAEALEPTGWLGESLGVLAARAECSLTEAERILARLQQIEPAGIFARDLAECLRLQAHERGILSPAMDMLLAHLDLIARGKIDTLAELCATSSTEILALISRIRSLDPKPGLVFAPDDAPIRPPDVIIERTGENGWRIELNKSTAPEITLRTGTEGIGSEAAFEAARDEARWIMRAVSRRNATVLKVVGAVIALQSEYLEKGVAGLRPLTRAQAADKAGLHETTVGRVANAILVQTPKGTVPLARFFSAALKGAGDAEEVSAERVRLRLRELIEAENPEAPLNDAALAENLGTEGIQVARRTIAKYRDAMGLASSRARRVRYRTTRQMQRADNE